MRRTVTWQCGCWLRKLLRPIPSMPEEPNTTPRRPSASVVGTSGPRPSSYTPGKLGEHPNTHRISRLSPPSQQFGVLFVSLVCSTNSVWIEQRRPVRGTRDISRATERSLRPLVNARKVSGGTRSAAGSTTRMTLYSLAATTRMQGKDPVAACQQLLLAPPSTPSPLSAPAAPR